MKKLLILLLIVFLTGCTVRYDLTINNDLSVSEEMYGLEDASFYNVYPKDTRKDIVYSLLDTQNEMLVKYMYDSEYYTDGDLSGVKLSRQFESLDDYITGTISYKHYFDKITQCNIS